MFDSHFQTFDEAADPSLGARIASARNTGIDSLVRALREDIDGLEKKLLILNLLATPVLVGAFSFWFYRRRKK